MAEYRAPESFNRHDFFRPDGVSRRHDPLATLLEEARLSAYSDRVRPGDGMAAQRFTEQRCGISRWPCAEITPGMVRIGDQLLGAFDRRMGSVASAVPSGIISEGIYLTKATSEPPMFDSNRFASLTRQEPNLERMLMERLSSQPGTITQKMLTEAALEVCTTPEQLTDKKMALLLLHNFTKNLTAMTRNPSLLDQQSAGEYPGNTYGQLQAKSIVDRLEELSQSKSQSDRMGQIYHFYGAALATYAFDRGSWVGVQRYWRLVSSTDPRNSAKNGADMLGYQLGRRLQKSEVIDRLLSPH